MVRLCGVLLVDQAVLLDGVALDAFSVEQDGLAAAEIDVSRRQVAQALVAAPVVVVVDECLDWPAAGLVDTEIRFSNRIGGPHAATGIQSGVQS